MHKRVTITDNVMFVSGVPFLVTLSRKLRVPAEADGENIGGIPY